jgi:hypothetical protein
MVEVIDNGLGLWRCTCGGFNQLTFKWCPKCKASRDDGKVVSGG